MSGLEDNEGLGQGFPYASANELLDAEVEQEGLDHSSESPVIIGQSVVMNTQVHFNGNSDFEEVPPKPQSATPSGEADGSVGSEEEEKDMVPSNEVANVQANEEAGSGDVGHENVGEIMEMNDRVNGAEAVQAEENHTTVVSLGAEKAGRENLVNMEGTNQSFPFGSQSYEGDESGTEAEQAEFMKELENFFKERKLEFKPPKFYGEGLNCLKLWRAVTKLGGYDTVTSCKLWRQVGESFKPPKTCTTVSWSFRIFYEKALLDYERHKVHGGELCVPTTSPAEPVGVGNQVGAIQASGSGRARRDAAARAMQGWHSQRLLGNGEVGDPIIKDKSSVSIPKREKHLKSLGVLKRKKPSSIERAVKAARTKVTKQQLRSLDNDGQVSLSASRMDSMVVDIGPTADWVKINVRRTRDCFEIYALVPGLLREEVRVQSDPAGRLVISGEPEQLDNPWGVTPFKKVISLPSRIDPHQTSAVVTLHGQLFVRAPYEQSDL